MAEHTQFGSQDFGDKAPGNQPGDAAHCAQCEAMLADALDGTLSSTDQAIFDIHTAHCGPCSQMLADARRGAAWLEMLRDPRPEPPAELLGKILAQTSGQPVLRELPGAALLPVPIYAAPSAEPASGKILPFRSRFTNAASAFGQIVRQPRLAMTAAMAFFSIALTMNLTGVRLQDLHASDLSPASLQRDFYSTNARVVQYYEGLRVVYELESRVHEVESTSDSDAPAVDQPATAEPPAAQPAPAIQKAVPPPVGNPPVGNQPQRKRAAPNPRTSRREDLNQTHRLIAAVPFRNTIHPRVERTLA